MSDALPAISGLTQEESEFVYNTEILGLPMRKAASMANLPIGSATKPHLIQARENAKRELRGSLQITKEDVVHGMSEAVGRARLLGEPMTEIVGWEKIAKLLGYDAPTRVDISVRASIEVLQSQVRGMSDDDLIKALGAGSIIDAEFYEAQKDS